MDGDFMVAETSFHKHNFEFPSCGHIKGLPEHFKYSDDYFRFFSKRTNI